MRILILTMALSLLSISADAKPRKRARHAKAPAPAAAHIVPNDRPAREHARAEAELADLRAGRIGGEAPQSAEPAQVWAVQENDREVPPALRQKK
jgi:alkylhydroperoxidase family enzyme